MRINCETEVTSFVGATYFKVRWTTPYWSPYLHDPCLTLKIALKSRSIYYSTPSFCNNSKSNIYRCNKTPPTIISKNKENFKRCTKEGSEINRFCNVTLFIIESILYSSRNANNKIDLKYIHFHLSLHLPLNQYKWALNKNKIYALRFSTPPFVDIF